MVAHLVLFLNMKWINRIWIINYIDLKFMILKKIDGEYIKMSSYFVYIDNHDKIDYFKDILPQIEGIIEIINYSNDIFGLLEINDIIHYKTEEDEHIYQYIISDTTPDIKHSRKVYREFLNKSNHTIIAIEPYENRRKQYIGE